MHAHIRWNTETQFFSGNNFIPIFIPPPAVFIPVWNHLSPDHRAQHQGVNHVDRTTLECGQLHGCTQDDRHQVQWGDDSGTDNESGPLQILIQDEMPCSGPQAAGNQTHPCRNFGFTSPGYNRSFIHTICCNIQMMLDIKTRTTHYSFI